ncbi:MAG: hypothetical protein KME30_26110 [Iphinoe sp. HA4291-MV1]|nr:hypothetical protein [Iphinoe sp. HA4291-MV1]
MRITKNGYIWVQRYGIYLGYSRDTCKMGHVVKFCKQKQLKTLICRDFEPQLGSVEPKILEAIAR